MNNLISFQISPPPRFLGTNSYHEAGKNYLLFSISLNERVIFNFWNRPFNPPLIVPDNGSDLINLFKTAEKDDIFTTPLTNLQFKPDFLTWDDIILNGLLIKDTSQVQKSTTNNRLLYPEFTFKVIKQSGFKEIGEGYKSENKLLEIEIEPLDLGIEGLPKITKIQLYFFTSSPQEDERSSDKHLDRIKYEKLFGDATGKEFIIKTKKIIFGDRQIAKIGQSLVYNTLSFSLEGDVKEVKSSNGNSPPQPEPKNNNNNSSTDNSDTPKIVLIVGGIIAGLILIISLFYFWKRKSSFKK